MQHSKANITKRIEALDALRGVALLAITFRHFLTRYNYVGSVYSSNDVLMQLDKLVEFVDYHIFFGKAYSIFALLFGFSLFLQRSSKSYTGSHRYIASRLIVLLLFSVINSLFFPGGDILSLYAISGVLILPAINLSSKWLLLLSCIFLFQPFEWIEIIVALINNGDGVLLPSSAALHQQITHVIATGSVVENLWTNVTTGQLSSLVWSLETGRFTQTIGLMLFGFYLGKSCWLQRIISEGMNALSYTYIPLFISIILFGVDYLIIRDSFIELKMHVILSNWINLCIALLYILLFVSIYQKIVAQYMPSIKAYGRMSLTNYLLQSVVGGFLFAPFGLDLARTLSATSIVLVFLLLVTGQIIFSNRWFIKHKYGPCEYYWRRCALALSNLKPSGSVQHNRNY